MYIAFEHFQKFPSQLSKDYLYEDIYEKMQIRSKRAFDSKSRNLSQ